MNPIYEMNHITENLNWVKTTLYDFDCELMHKYAENKSI